MRPAIVVAPLALMSALTIATADADGTAVGIKAGTLGLGLEVTQSLTDRLNLRAGLNSYNYRFEATESDVKYDLDLDLGTSGLMLDWHPFAGGFRISVGALYNKNEIGLKATPSSNQTIGGTTYTPAQIGQLTGTVSFKKSAPYVGMGWGSNVAKDKGLGFTVELGALYQGTPEVSLDSSGSVSAADLKSEEQQVQDDLDNFKLYPVVSFGVAYQF